MEVLAQGFVNWPGKDTFSALIQCLPLYTALTPQQARACQDALQTVAMALRVFERWLPLKRDLVLRAFSGSLRPLLLLVRGQSGYAAYTSGTSTPFSELLNLERRASLREAAQQLSELCALEEAITKHLDTEQSKRRAVVSAARDMCEIAQKEQQTAEARVRSAQEAALRADQAVIQLATSNAPTGDFVSNLFVSKLQSNVGKRKIGDVTGALRSRAEAIENKCMHDALHALSAAWLACLQLITTSLEDSEGGYGKALKNCRARLNAVSEAKEKVRRTIGGPRIKVEEEEERVAPKRGLEDRDHDSPAGGQKKLK